MGIGSLCARKSVQEIREIVEAVQAELPGTWFHLFGVKLSFFKAQVREPLRCISADTAAWGGRFGRDILRFNAVMARQGWTQNMTEVRWALPDYRRRFYRAAMNWSQGSAGSSLGALRRRAESRRLLSSFVNR